jgi:hypothetical protein
MAYPWPFELSPQWVEAKTMYLKDQAFVERPLTTKEMAQLLDLREDWGTKLVEEVWQWSSCGPPPL